MKLKIPLLILLCAAPSACIRQEPPSGGGPQGLNDRPDASSGPDAAAPDASAPARPPEELFPTRVCALHRPIVDLNALSPCDETLHTQATVTATPQRFRGFPELEGLDEWFTLDIGDSFENTTPGTHRLWITSDDHAILWIDGQRVLENPAPTNRAPGRSPTTVEGTVELSAGRHVFKLFYLHGRARQLSLQLEVQPPGQARQPFSRSF